MAGCVLRAAGETFSVDEFLANSSFQPCNVYHAGEAKWHSEKLYDKSGFTVIVSEADGDDLTGQIRDAVDFLTQHQDEITRLKGFVNGESLLLDFGLWRKDVYAQYSYLPPELLLLAGRLQVGIELSIYGGDSKSLVEGGNV